ncbi:MAG: hypothetical protein IJK02_09325, partial [Clostridia bacterium]|nr:hypothetical protein [Clostridia bacterium]
MKKTMRTVLSLLLAVLMVVSALPLAGVGALIPAAKAAQGPGQPEAPSDYWQVGDRIRFGEYPQTLEADPDVLEALDDLEKDWVSYGYYYIPEDANGLAYPAEPGDFMRYADLDLDGVRYRAVTFSHYRPWFSYSSFSDLSEEDSYQDDNGFFPGEVYYFRYEPLYWRVLDPVTGLVLCENLIDAQHFDYDSETQQYPDSDIRQWLLDDFFNTAFLPDEQALIAETMLPNGTDREPKCYEYSVDTVFLLSYQDATDRAARYFTNGVEIGSSPTDYARCQGVYTSDKGRSDWFLRTACDFYSGHVAAGSRYSTIYTTEPLYYLDGVRPAFCFGGEIVNQDQNEPIPIECQTGDEIMFGRYPQDRVTDEDTLAALEEQPKRWVSYGYYSGSGSVNDPQMQPGDWMKYADVMLDGVKYRAVLIQNNRPNYVYGALSGSGNQVTNGYEATETPYYFRYEALRWVVLDPEAGLVLCKSIIDSQPFNNTFYKEGSDYWQTAEKAAYANNYAESSVRQWLNNDFYNTAFTETEKNRIAQTALVNDSYVNGYESASTNDKLFFLSYSDVSNRNYGFDGDASRNAYATDYAKAQGVHVNANKSYSSNWMLRTAATSSQSMTSVLAGGSPAIAQATYMAILGMRPAFCFANGKIIESLHPDEAEIPTQFEAGDILPFGAYPQTEITRENEPALYDALEAAEKDWHPYWFYSGTGNLYDAEMLPGDWMQFADVKYYGVKYRAVTFTAYRPQFTGDETAAENSLQDDNGYETGKTCYFRYEPLYWRVLDPDSGLILCMNTVDAGAFQNTVYEDLGEFYQNKLLEFYANNYAESSLRQWLNNDFYYTAFAPRERELISAVTVTNAAVSAAYQEFECEPTEDFVFLPGYGDVFDADLVPEGMAAADVWRSAPTAYAKCLGAADSAPWRLRSPADTLHAATVNADGTLDDAFAPVNDTSAGVRPCILLGDNLGWSQNPYGGGGYVPKAVETPKAKDPLLPISHRLDYTVENGLYCGEYEHGHCRWTYDPATGEMVFYPTGENATVPPGYEAFDVQSPYDFGADVKSIKIEEGIKHIGWGAFNYMYSLRTLDIASTVENKTITDDYGNDFNTPLLYGLYNLETLVVRSETMHIISGRFEGDDQYRMMYALCFPTYLSALPIDNVNDKRAVMELRAAYINYAMGYRNDLGLPDMDGPEAENLDLVSFMQTHVDRVNQKYGAHLPVPTSENMAYQLLMEPNAQRYSLCPPYFRLVCAADSAAAADWNRLMTVTRAGMELEYQNMLDNPSLNPEAPGAEIPEDPDEYREQFGYFEDRFLPYPQKIDSIVEIFENAMVDLAAWNGGASQALAITAHPTAVTAAENTKATFTVKATGTGLTYAWRTRPDSNASWTYLTDATEGYNTDTLKITAATALDGYRFQCVVHDATGAVKYSRDVPLTVVPSLAITTHPSSVTANENTTATFTVKAVGAGLTYAWRSRPDSSASWTYLTSAAEGYNTDTLKIAATMALNGYRFQCVVKDASGAVKYSRDVSLTVVPSFAITEHPTAVTANENTTATFTVKATGAGLTYAWRSRPNSSASWTYLTSAAEGYNTDTLKIAATMALNGYRFQCVVKDASGAVKYSR